MESWSGFATIAVLCMTWLIAKLWQHMIARENTIEAERRDRNCR